MLFNSPKLSFEADIHDFSQLSMLIVYRVHGQVLSDLFPPLLLLLLLLIHVVVEYAD